MLWVLVPAPPLTHWASCFAWLASTPLISLPSPSPTATILDTCTCHLATLTTLTRLQGGATCPTCTTRPAQRALWRTTATRRYPCTTRMGTTRLTTTTGTALCTCRLRCPPATTRRAARPLLGGDRLTDRTAAATPARRLRPLRGAARTRAIQRCTRSSQVLRCGAARCTRAIARRTRSSKVLPRRVQEHTLGQSSQGGLASTHRRTHRVAAVAIARPTPLLQRHRLISCWTPLPRARHQRGRGLCRPWCRRGHLRVRPCIATESSLASGTPRSASSHC